MYCPGRETRSSISDNGQTGKHEIRKNFLQKNLP